MVGPNERWLQVNENITLTFTGSFTLKRAGTISCLSCAVCTNTLIDTNDVSCMVCTTLCVVMDGHNSHLLAEISFSHRNGNDHLHGLSFLLQQYVATMCRVMASFRTLTAFLSHVRSLGAFCLSSLAAVCGSALHHMHRAGSKSW